MFWRGIHALQRRLNTRWNSGEYYLGEWHYHPGGTGKPSTSDIDQMIRIAKSLPYNTPEPILIVVGGDEWDVTAHVFPRDCSPISLMVSTSDKKTQWGISFTEGKNVILKDDA